MLNDQPNLPKNEVNGRSLVQETSQAPETVWFNCYWNHSCDLINPQWKKKWKSMHTTPAGS